jgi:A/G-specific adenine glycosylase
MQHHQGKFPDDYNSIRALKGIGEYTAAAITSISFNLEYPAVDGNVYRILSRFFGIQEPIDTSAGKKIFMDLAIELIKDTNPGMHNQALMEFGALQCTPRNPDCIQCVLMERCYAFASGKIGDLPVKQIKIKQRDRYFTYLIFEHNNCTWLHQRTKNDIWKGLYEFPVIETSKKTDVDYILTSDECNVVASQSDITVQNCSSWKIHILSHQKIHYRFVQISLSDEIKMQDEFVKVNKEDILSFAIPKLLETSVDEFIEKRKLDI